METKARTEWNGLPGYLAAERLIGDGERASFNGLELGITADTMDEFLKQPIEAIEKKIKEGTHPGKEEPKDLLTQLILRVGCVFVMAERERVAEEGRHVRRAA